MLLPSYICLSPATVSHTLYLPAGCGISPCLNHGQTKCFGSVWSSIGQSGYVTAVRYTTWCSTSLSNTHTHWPASSALTGSETLKPTLHCIFACCCRSHWYTLPIQVFSLVIISILHPVCSHFIILIDPPPPPSPCYCLVLDWDVNLMTRLRSLTMCCVWQAQTEANLHVACHW